jgi:hypothetical protein
MDFECHMANNVKRVFITALMRHLLLNYTLFQSHYFQLAQSRVYVPILIVMTV